MDDLLAHLGAGERVLDLGSGLGSFPYSRYSCRIVAVDATARPVPRGPEGQARLLVRGRGAALPFEKESFAAVIASHFFEHQADPALVVREVARVLRPGGVLFAAIPGGASCSDRLYRFWTRDGGHVQKFAFRGFQEVVERNSDLELLYARRLYASFSFLRPRPEAAIHLPRRSQLLKYLPGWARDAALGGFNAVTRAADALFGARFSLYGWACYFGRPRARLAALNRQEYLNVCSRCGAGHPVDRLKDSGARLSYCCPQCGCRNPFFGDWLSRRITGRPWTEEESFHSADLPGAGAPAAPFAVVNAASYTPEISPGCLIAVFASNLAVPGTELLVSGQPVPLLHVSDRQLIAFLPRDLPRGPATFEIRRVVEILAVPLTLTSPGLFSVDQTGQGTAVTLPARGGRIGLLATGLGPVTQDGLTTRACRAWVAGREARVEYAGLSKQADSCGVYEIVISVPRDIRANGGLVHLLIGGRRSNTLLIPAQ